MQTLLLFFIVLIIKGSGIDVLDANITLWNITVTHGSVLTKKQSHEKNNTVVKVTPPSKNIVLLFCQPEKVVISISLPN